MAKESKHLPDPELTPQAREDQLIAMAYNEVERRISEGIATGPELVHFLRMGSMKGRLEKELLEQETRLARAKIEQINTQKDLKELYTGAIEALKSYRSDSDE